MFQAITESIRNVVLLGHSKSGKTSLCEALCHTTKMTQRLGAVTAKNSIFDNSDEERAAGHTIDTAIAHIHYKNHLINIFDTPGCADFSGAVYASIPACETAFIIIDGKLGIEPNTHKWFHLARSNGLAIVFVITKIDEGTSNLQDIVTSIQSEFGRGCICADLATTDGCGVRDCIHHDSGDGTVFDLEEMHTVLLETVIESDEALMERYLNDETISDQALTTAFTKDVALQIVTPIVFTSTTNEIGIIELLDIIIEECPSPISGLAKTFIDAHQSEKQIISSVEGDLLAVVVRIISDPKSHIRYTTLRIVQGVLFNDANIKSASTKKAVRCGHLFRVLGDKLIEIDRAIAGDIVTIGKHDNFTILDTIFSGGGANNGYIKTPVCPMPMYARSIETQSQSDEAKLALAFNEITHCDPTISITLNAQTNETVIAGLGELHLRSIFEKLEKYRQLKVTTKIPEIPYRETITHAAKHVEYTHKKQSGGSGQYARVFIDMEPMDRGEGYTFIDKIFGGSIDQPFRPSVDKGCQSAMHEGVLAGFPVVDVRITLVDGKTHPVDSKDIAFQHAGKGAFKKAFKDCEPTLLEPIVDIEVTTPTKYVGDITGDLASKRGRMQGQDTLAGNISIVKAAIPLSEIQQYNSQLMSVTGGQGSYALSLSHYEAVPTNLQKKIIEKRHLSAAGA